MSTYYGDGLATSDSTFVRSYTQNVGSFGARSRWFRSSITRLITTSDLARMIVLPSRARIWQLFLVTDGAATAGATDVGLYYAGSNADGAVIDADFFATAVVVTSASSADIFAERSAALAVNRGKTLWELAGLSSDPQVPIHITMTPSANFTVTAPVVVLLANVTLGD